MAIPDGDMKVLWGRAAGICSNPTCREDLSIILTSGEAYNVGEMAHVIAKNDGGPRGITGGGPDTYENLLLLCPTCHRKIDKAPEGVYPNAMLHDWKREHEKNIRSVGQEKKFNNISELKKFVAPLLMENKLFWAKLGPESEAATNNPSSDAQEIWVLRKLDKIVPNNRRIENSIQSNLDLLSGAELEAFMEFKLHSSSFEHSQYQRVDQYHLFPKKFAELFAL